MHPVSRIHNYHCTGWFCHLTQARVVLQDGASVLKMTPPEWSGQACGGVSGPMTEKGRPSSLRGVPALDSWSWVL